MFVNNVKSRRCKECKRSNKEEIKSPTAMKVCANGTYNHDITLHQMAVRFLLHSFPITGHLHGILCQATNVNIFPHFRVISSHS